MNQSKKILRLPFELEITGSRLFKHQPKAFENIIIQFGLVTALLNVGTFLNFSASKGPKLSRAVNTEYKKYPHYGIQKNGFFGKYRGEVPTFRVSGFEHDF